MREIGAIYHSPEGTHWYERFSVVLDSKNVLFFYNTLPYGWLCNWTDGVTIPDDTEIYEII